MITVLGSLNMDLVLETERFPLPGETVRGRNFRRSRGGKGANQALAVARMGGRAVLLGAVGQDEFGASMCADLEAQGVNTRGVGRRVGVPSGMAWITLDAQGQNQIIVVPGANDTVTAAEVESARDTIASSQMLLLQLEVPLSVVEAALRIAQESRVPAILNVAPFAPVPDETLRRCTWILANEAEAALLSGEPVTSSDSAAAAATALHRRVPRAAVAITLGRAGVWVSSAEFSGHVPGFPVAAVDTVGAGDTFVGAYAVRLSEGADVREAARFACAAAALAVTRSGAQASIPTRAEVEAWLAQRDAEC